MGVSITTLIVVAIILLSLAFVFQYCWTAKATSKQGDVKPSAADDLVKIRDASSVKLSLESASQAHEQVLPAQKIADKSAEDELTIIDELRDPSTSVERRMYIEKELQDLGYTFKGSNHKADVSSGNHTSQGSLSAKPSGSDDACDEGLDEYGPQFDPFYDPYRK